MRIIALMLLAASAHAGPYFRLADLSKPQVVTGAYLDPADPGMTAFGSAVALVTHSTRDGCAFPTIVCEDWSPLTVGFTSRAGQTHLGIGPSFNLSPLVKAGALRLLGAVTAEDSYSNLKATLGSEPINGPDVTASFGPAVVFNPAERWKGYFRIFAGAAWRFGP